jgi:threonine dehydrogenase-like Zn-dependent dehydrogenase
MARAWTWRSKRSEHKPRSKARCGFFAPGERCQPFAAGLGDHKIVTTLCAGGKERMRRLMELVRHGRLDLRPLLTHTFSLDRITEAYELFG